MIGGALAATIPVDCPTKAESEKAPIIHLRLLATSDLHSHIFSYDYLDNKPDDRVGFAKTATLIDQARREVKNSLLFDNGDIIQGSALADFVASQGIPSRAQVHPMFAVMNRLKYDVATIGNHEFDFGLGYLEGALEGPSFPVVCCNAIEVDGSLMLPPYVILERVVEDEDGRPHSIRIGVIGFVTPEFMTFDKSQVDGKVSAMDIVGAARKFVPELRKKVDILVALSHSGIDAAPHTSGQENASLQLATVPGIDVIFTGHQHRVFPGPQYAGLPDVDAVRGTLHGVPAVMPGFWGSHLGIIDLILEKRAAWSLGGFQVEARPIYRDDKSQITSLATADAITLNSTRSEHRATMTWFDKPFTKVSHPITSYFAYVGASGAVDVVTAALQRYAEVNLIGMSGQTPLLAASAPLMMGWEGPDSFTDVPAGPVSLRDITDLWMDPNNLCVVKVNGGIIREWLERSACIFNQLDPRLSGPQELINTRLPSYTFDVIAGVSYRIDTTQPARYAADGALLRPAARRIVDLELAGAPVRNDQTIFVATNSWRADGGHKFPGLDGSNVVLRSKITIRDIVKEYLTAEPLIPRSRWSLTSSGHPVAAKFRSGQGALKYLAGVPNIKTFQPSQDGYVELETLLG